LNATASYKSELNCLTDQGIAEARLPRPGNLPSRDVVLGYAEGFLHGVSLSSGINQHA